MPPLKNSTILFDLSHGEMLNVQESDYSEFLSLLKSLNLTIKKNQNKSLTQKILNDIDTLVIGNPINNYFSNTEIKTIIDFVRKGGRLLLVSEYGADYIQRTNLNDISGIFGIFFQKNIIKEYNKINQNCSSILSIQDFEKHKITNQLRDIVIGGSCSLFLNKNSKPLLKTNDTSVWSEIYNNSAKQWSKDDENKRQIIAAYTDYGRGKVIALGDIDIFTNDPYIGINQLDNRKLILNILNWFMQPVKESDVIIWTLNQLGTIQNEIKEINSKINNIIETMTILERRISRIDEIENVEKFKETVEKDHIERELS